MKKDNECLEHVLFKANHESSKTSGDTRDDRSSHELKKTHEILLISEDTSYPSHIFTPAMCSRTSLEVGRIALYLAGLCVGRVSLVWLVL